jgi:hypothetical protein
VVDEGAAFSANHICAGNSIFGLSGTAPCITGNPVLLSNRMHTVGSTSYHLVPIVGIDDDGLYNSDNGCASGCTPVIALTSLQHANYSSCGTTQNTIATRITDCAATNGVNAMWNGAAQSNSGESTWKLVTRSASMQEVWQDQRTGLLWSSALPGTYNWCLASGNGEATDATCSNTAYQPSVVTPQSICAESGTVAVPGYCTGASQVTPAGCSAAAGTWTSSSENFASFNYSLSKGGMGANSSPQVQWRLPTLSDYNQAEIDGMRYVLPQVLDTTTWAATVRSNVSAQAWSITFNPFLAGPQNRTQYHSVRCVGH